MRYVFSLILLTVCFFSCERERIQTLDPVFEPFVDQFFLEAQQRGMDVKKSDFSFSLQFGTIDDAHGRCRNRDNEMTIDPDFWEDAYEREKEYLIFHELGHCILNRRHDNEILEYGQCKSIMKGAEDGQVCERSLFSDVWRDYYLDELFDHKTPLPDWYLLAFDITVDQELISFQDSMATQLQVPVLELDTDDNFEFIAFFQKSNYADPVDIAWGPVTASFFAGNNILISYPASAIYFAQQLDISEQTAFRLLQVDGFQYFFLDEKVLYIDQLDPNFFTAIRLSMAPSSMTSDIGISLTVNQLK